MTQAELLDALAKVLDSPPYNGRWGDAKLAFAALAEHLETNWWIRLARKIRGEVEK